ncbi:glutaredoxin family protein [Haliea atlantica]
MPDPGDPPLTLYGTSACHLCEQAEAVLQRVLDAGLVSGVAVVDISETEDLMQRFALRIPVLKSADGRELDWPFGEAEVLAFLSPA